MLDNRGMKLRGIEPGDTQTALGTNGQRVSLAEERSP